MWIVWAFSCVGFVLLSCGYYHPVLEKGLQKMFDVYLNFYCLNKTLLLRRRIVFLLHVFRLFHALERWKRGLHSLSLCAFSLAEQLPTEFLRGRHHGRHLQDLQDVSLGGLDWVERHGSHSLGLHPLHLSALPGTVVTQWLASCLVGW